MCLEAACLESLTVTTMRSPTVCIWFRVREITPGPMEFGLAATSSYMQTSAALLPAESFMSAPMSVCASAAVNRPQGLAAVTCGEAAALVGGGLRVTPPFPGADGLAFAPLLVPDEGPSVTPPLGFVVGLLHEASSASAKSAHFVRFLFAVPLKTTAPLQLAIPADGSCSRR